MVLHESRPHATTPTAAQNDEGDGGGDDEEDDYIMSEIIAAPCSGENIT